jgi:hypothetical protein
VILRPKTIPLVAAPATLEKFGPDPTEELFRWNAILHFLSMGMVVLCREGPWKPNLPATIAGVC